MQRFGLYYPYVHFADDSWIKASALYWPKMARIIPPNFLAHDSTTVRELRDSLNFIIDVDPRPVVEYVSEITRQAVGAHGSELRSRFGIEQLNFSTRYIPRTRRAMFFDDETIVQYSIIRELGSAARPEPSPSTFAREAPLEGRLQIDRRQAMLTEIPGGLGISRSRLVGLHGHETTSSLRKLLLDNGLAVAGDAGWIGVHPKMAWVFLSALAAELAARNTMVPVTDETADHLASDPWDAGRIASALLSTSSTRSDSDVFSAAGLLALRIVIPADLDVIPTAKIVAIRQTYGAEFDAFYDSIEQLANDLTSKLQETTEPKVLEEYLSNEVRIRFQQPLRELERALRGLRVDTAFGATNLKFELPAAVATATGGILAGSPLLATAGAAAFAAIGLVRSAKANTSAKLTPSGTSYLLRVDRKINPRSLINRIRAARQH